MKVVVLLIVALFTATTVQAQMPVRTLSLYGDARVSGATLRPQDGDFNAARKLYWSGAAADLAGTALALSRHKAREVGVPGVAGNRAATVVAVSLGLTLIGDVAAKHAHEANPYDKRPASILRIFGCVRFGLGASAFVIALR